MFQNLKVDVIYYKTNTDFEMEFNLCGCCRMRLLTDKAPDRKVALHSLARAVSRSRIIIVIGSLFGDDSIVNLISGAIASDLQTVDNKTYGISGDSEIKILKGATPLVTKEGYFGGCIIESGPQTMILLSENKNIRKPIMQTLIHPYVEELCAIELKEKAASVSESNSIITEETEIITADGIADENELQELVNVGITEETDQVADDTEAEAITEDEHLEELPTNEVPDSDNSFEFIQETEDKFAQEEVNSALDSDSENDDFIIEFSTSKAKFAPKIKDDALDEKFIGEDSNFKAHRPSTGLNIFIVLITIFMLIALAVLCYCIFYIPARNGTDTTAYIKETFDILFGKA